MVLPIFPNSRALLTGVSTYSDAAALDNLESVEANLEDFFQILTDPNLSGFDTNSCKRILNPPTPDALLTSLDEVSQQAEELLLFYFSGHGVLLGAQGDLHLALAASDRSRFWSYLPFAQVNQVVQSSAARVKVVILDCCYSGRVAGVMGNSSAEALTADQVEIGGTY